MIEWRGKPKRIGSDNSPEYISHLLKGWAERNDITPMALVSTRRAYGRRQGQALIHAYMDRWCVEEGFRFSKQGFGLEGVMARKMNALKNRKPDKCNQRKQPLIPGLLTPPVWE